MSNEMRKRRLERLGHLQAAQRDVVAAVDDFVRAWPEEEGQERAGQQQDDERVERDLAEHERPVVREDLVEVALQEPGGAKPTVDFAERLLHYLGRRLRAVRPACRPGRLRAGASRRHERSQKLGPTGWSNAAVAMN